MTTLLSQPTTGTAKRPAATTPASNQQRRKTVPLIVAGLVVVGAALVAWAFVGLGGASTGIGVVDRAEVQPRTFNVVLKEKGELKAAKSTDIKCEVEGRSTIINLIPEGTAVQKGQLLVELASADIEDRIRQEELKESNALTEFEAAKTEVEIQREKNASDIRKADLQIELRTLELQKYEKGDWVQKLKDADIGIEQAQMSLERREQDYTASKELYAKNYTTQTEHDEAEFNFRKAEWDLEKAKMTKAVLEQYTHIAEFKQRESDVHEAIKEAERVKKNAEAEEIKKLRSFEGKEKELALIRDQLAKFRGQKEKCKIYAPTQGFVVYYTGGGGGRWMMNNDQQVKEGAEVFERQILMQLPDTSVMNAVVRIHEAKTDKLHEGQSATVTVEGIPGRQFTGKVSKIAVLADSQSSWLNPDLKEYETEITLDPSDVPLKPGVTAHTEILVETVVDKPSIPMQAVYAKGGKRYVFKDVGSRVEHIPVELGSIGSEWVEIVSGVSSGDSILLAFNDELKRLIPDGGPGESRGGAPGGGQKRGPGGSPGGGGPQRAGGPGGKPKSGEFNAVKRDGKGAIEDTKPGQPGTDIKAQAAPPGAAGSEKPADGAASTAAAAEKPASAAPNGTSSGTSP